MLNFENAAVLSYSQNSQFFGQIFRYQNQKNLSVQGVIRDVDNYSGVSGIQYQINQFFSGDNDYQPITINGYSFGTGKITSVNFDQGNDVRLKNYTVDIICYESGNLFNLTGLYYTGIQDSNNSPYHLLDNLSEDFSYNKNGSTFGYSHSVNLKFNSGSNPPQSPIEMAKSLAAKLIYSNVPFGFLISGENTGIGRKLYNESYDLISNECSFTESYDRPINNNGLLYTLTNSFERNENGIATVGEEANIKNITGTLRPEYFNENWIEMGSLLTGAFSRCSGIFSNYAESGSYPLYSGYTTLGKNINPFEGVASYNISFTNNPAQLSGFSWNYTNEISKSDRYYQVSENGVILGHGIPQNFGIIVANNAYNNIKPSIYSRVYSFYTGYVDVILTLNQVSENKSSSIFNGSVNYSAQFTDNPTYSTADPLIRREVIEVNDSIPTPLINRFNIFNFKEIVQPANNATLGARSVSISLLGRRDITLTGFKNYAKIKLNENLPSGTDPFLTNINYNYNPIQKEFSANANWNFQRNPTNIII